MAYQINAEEIAAAPATTAVVLPLDQNPIFRARKISTTPSLSPVVVAGLARLAEFAVLTLTGWLIAEFYVNEAGVLNTPRYLIAAPTVAAGTLIAAHFLRLYTIHELTAFVTNMPRVVAAWSVAFLGFLAAVFFLKMGSDISRVWLATWFISGAVAILAIRFATSITMKRLADAGRLYQRAVVYGSGDVTDDVVKRIEADTDSIIHIAGIFDDRDDSRAPREIAGYPRLGGIDALISMSRTTPIDLVIVALPLAAEQRLQSVVRRLSVLPADIKLPAGSTSLRFSPGTYSRVGSLAMLDLYDKPLADWSRVSKWLFDKVIGLIALILLAPVMAAVALAVKLDSRGPVLFRQKRYGFNNELIEVYKFRSMYTDRCDANAQKLVTKEDPRVTRVGRIIRKTSLDELPQLFNVLKGTLSLVGPRPHAVQAKAGTELYDKVVDDYFARHKVKPGITGWAQINGWRGETDTEEKLRKRVEHDLYYIENWSLFLDLTILAKTPISLLKTENAY